MSNKGVTLVELLIIIVVLALVSSFSVIGVSSVLENFRQKGFVQDARVILIAAENAYFQNDDIWDDNKATLGELIDAGYISINQDPWGGEYDLEESYVVTEKIMVGNSKVISLSTTPTSKIQLKVKIVSENAIIGYFENLADFSKSDIHMLDGNNESLITRVKESITGSLWSTVLKDDNHDEIETDNNMYGNSLIDAQGGDDYVLIGGSMYGSSNIDSGDGNDIVTISGEVVTNGSIKTGDGNDTVNVSKTFKGNSKIDSGDGDDTITVGWSIYGSASIDAGSGNNTVDVLGEVSTNGEIKTGNGQDIINIASNLKSNSTVDTGDGNDAVNVQNVFGNGSIFTGAGNDIVTITSTIDSSGTIDLGSGNDTLVLSVRITTNSNVVQGGSGNDTLVLSFYSVSDWNSWLKNYFHGFETIQLKDGTINQ